MKSRSINVRIICAAALTVLMLLTACVDKTPSQKASSESGSWNGSAGSQDAASISMNAENDRKNTDSINLTLATFNIKHGAEGLENIAEAIRDVSPDIIGLQEVDVNCERSGYADEPAELAKLAGYPYYAFARAIPLGTGEYGTAILSRYPIESFDVIPLESGNGEDRSVGHAVVSADGLKLDVFVTHLSFEDRSVRIGQMKTIARMLKRCDHYVLFGDLNSFNIEDIAYLDAAYYVNRADRRYQTFRRFNSSPDNIVLSEGFTELSTGVSDAECSDHRLLYGTFRLEE